MAIEDDKTPHSDSNPELRNWGICQGRLCGGLIYPEPAPAPAPPPAPPAEPIDLANELPNTSSDQGFSSSSAQASLSSAFPTSSTFLNSSSQASSSSDQGFSSSSASSAQASLSSAFPTSSTQGALASSSSSSQAVNADLFGSTTTALGLLAGRSFSRYFTTTAQNSYLASSGLVSTTPSDPLGFGNQISTSSKNKQTSLNSYFTSTPTTNLTQEDSNQKNTSSLNQSKIDLKADNDNSQNDADDNKKYLGLLSLALIPAGALIYKLKQQKQDRNGDNDLLELLDKIKKLPIEQQKLIKEKLQDILDGNAEQKDFEINNLKIKAELVYIPGIFDELDAMNSPTIIIQDDALDQENQHQDRSDDLPTSIHPFRIMPDRLEPSSSTAELM